MKEWKGETEIRDDNGRSAATDGVPKGERS